MPSLDVIVSFDSISLKQQQKSQDAGLRLVTLEELEKIGEEYPSDPHPPTPDDIQTIMFTSGTTGALN